MATVIEVKAADGTLSRTRIETGSNRFSVKPGDSFRVYDEATGLSPPTMAVARLDNHVVITGLDRRGEEPVTRVELLEFYSVCSVGSPCQVEVQSAAGATPAIVTSSTQPIGALSDGSFVLYDPRFASTATAGAPASLSEGSGSQVLLYSVGGLALVGLAVGGGGGGGGSGTPSAVSANPPAATPAPAPVPAPAPAPSAGSGTDTTPPLPAQIATIGGDGRVTLSEKAAGVTIGGTGEVGALVTLAVNGLSKTATVDAGGNWRIGLAAGELGGEGAHAVSVRLTDAAGNVSAAATGSYTVDTVARLGAVGGADGIVNAVERLGGFAIAGTGPFEAPAGTLVNVTLAGNGVSLQRQVAVGANGAWSTTVAVTDGLPDGRYTISAAAQIGTVQGESVSGAVTIDTVAPGAPSQILVAGDNVIGLNERGAFAVSGVAEPGSTVVVSIDTIARQQSVVADAASGAWTAAGLSANTLVAGTNATVRVTVSDAAGNATQTTRSIPVERAVAIDDDAAALSFDALLSVGSPATDDAVAAASAGAMGTAIAATSAAQVSTLLDDPGQRVA